MTPVHPSIWVGVYIYVCAHQDSTYWAAVMHPPQGASDDIMEAKSLLYRHLTYDQDKGISLCGRLAAPLHTPASTSPPRSPTCGSTTTGGGGGGGSKADAARSNGGGGDRIAPDGETQIAKTQAD